jgi:hypothetical protein
MPTCVGMQVAETKQPIQVSFSIYSHSESRIEIRASVSAIRDTSTNSNNDGGGNRRSTGSGHERSSDKRASDKFVNVRARYTNIKDSRDSDIRTL